MRILAIGASYVLLVLALVSLGQGSTLFGSMLTLSIAAWVWRLPQVRLWRMRLHPRGIPWAPHSGIHLVRSLWQALDINAPTTADLRDIDRFEREYGVEMPDDVRTYFAMLNGTRTGEHGRDDPFGIGFWHLHEVRTFAETHVRADADAAQTFAFADRAIRIGGVYGLRLTRDGGAAPVMACLPSGCVQVADSFGEFLARYATGDLSVLFPEIEVIADEEGISAQFNGAVTRSIRWADVRMIAIEIARADDGAVAAVWHLAGDKPVSPLHGLFIPLVLSARRDAVTAMLQSRPGFDMTVFEAARAAERDDETGTFVCWRDPLLATDTSALS